VRDDFSGFLHKKIALAVRSMLALYVTLFFVVAQVINVLFFGVRPPIFVGGALIAGAISARVPLRYAKRCFSLGNRSF
jgi:hypothetical protein